MGQLELEGENLGKKHKHYNQILKDAIDKKKNPEKLNTEDNDVKNMLQIDIASNNRDVEYILEALKSEDMLYASRAIKRCTWLITDSQYAHIINPQYLYMQLFPQMTNKATHKLLLHIRLNLKDETRVDEFYNYYQSKNNEVALKWLLRCSLPVIEKEIEKRSEPLPISIFKRLCERSFIVLEKHLNKLNDYMQQPALKATMFLLNTDTEKYLDLVDTIRVYCIPNFGPTATSIIMKKAPQRLIDNFEKFSTKIDLETFAKYLKKSGIKPFLLKYIDKDSMQHWFKYENLKYFIKFIPKEGRFEFLKTFFIDKTHKQEKNAVSNFGAQTALYRYAPRSPSSININSTAYIYNWYKYATFDVAFPDLKKLIRTESSPSERNAILGVLLHCAGNNTLQAHTVLQHYHDKHINEPFKFKIQFVNMLLSQMNIKDIFADNIWKILNNIFYSMEVYTESENNVQYCIHYIILYKVLRNETVPDIIEKKFTFNTLKILRKKLNNEEKNRVFAYLFNILMKKIENQKIQTEADLTEAIDRLKDLVSLLTDWNKDITEYPQLIIEFRKIITAKQSNSWKADLKSLYTTNKKWRKHTFEESIIIRPSEESCINALKHDPGVLKRCKRDFETLQVKDNISLTHLLRKLRVYWPESLAKELIAFYLQRLDDPGATGHKSLIRGLCILLPQQQLLDILNKYVPTETKINWSEDNERLLNSRKQLAKYMHLSRPLLPVDVVLLYAQGDYLQYSLPSLDAILYDISSARSREHIPKLLNSPVSLQKHGIRLAFCKLTSEELKNTFANIWTTTSNSSIRAVLFKQTYNLLCKEKNLSGIKELWDLLSMFIDNLSLEENRIIYTSLGMNYLVPMAVRAAFSMKSYIYLKSLPAKANVNSILESILNNCKNIMECMDSNFMAEILLESLEPLFSRGILNQMTSIMSSYFLCAKDADTQNQRYEKVLIPFMDMAFAKWNVKINDHYSARDILSCLLMELKRDILKYTLERGMVFPIIMFINIQKKLEEVLPIKANYIMLRSWSLAITYLKMLEKHDKLIISIRQDLPPFDGKEDRYFNPESTKIWNEVYLKAAPDFAEGCVQLMKDDIKLYFTSIISLFARALSDTYQYFLNGTNQIVLFEILKNFLEYGDVECAIVALKILPVHMYSLEPNLEKEKWLEIRKILSSHESLEVNMHYYSKFGMCDLNFVPLVCEAT